MSADAEVIENEPAADVADNEALNGAPAEGQGEPAEQEDEPQQSAADVARALGWKPKAEWKGSPPPGGFKSAAEFIAEHISRSKAGREETSRLRRELKQIRERDAARDRREAADIAARYKRQRDEIVREGGDDANERLDKLEKERDDALKPYKAAQSAGDADDIDDEELADMIKASPNAKSFFVDTYPHLLEDKALVHAIMTRPLTQRFFVSNHWILADEPESKDAFAYVQSQADEMAKKGVPLSVMYRRLTKTLREEFPEYYEEQPAAKATEAEENEDVGGEEEEAGQPKDPATGRFVKAEPEEEKPPPRKPPVMATPARGNAGRHTLASKLTADERAAAAQDIKDGLFKNMDEYAARLPRLREARAS